MPGDFAARMEALSEMVGDGSLTGKVAVDQLYAAPLERGFWVTGPLAGHTNHPRHGGQTHYLRDGLTEGAPGFFERIAEGVLEPDGCYKAMVDDVEALSAQVGVRAPVEFGDLRMSGHPRVFDNGMLVYDRPPAVERLTRAELEAKSDLLERAHATRGRAGHPWASHGDGD